MSRLISQSGGGAGARGGSSGGVSECSPTSSDTVAAAAGSQSALSRSRFLRDVAVASCVASGVSHERMLNDVFAPSVGADCITAALRVALRAALRACVSDSQKPPNTVQIARAVSPTAHMLTGEARRLSRAGPRTPRDRERSTTAPSSLHPHTHSPPHSHTHTHHTHTHTQRGDTRIRWGRAALSPADLSLPVDMCTWEALENDLDQPTPPHQSG